MTHTATTHSNNSQATPTPTDLAGLIESTLVTAEPQVQCIPMLNWMLFNGQEARTLLEELTRPREGGGPTLLQFAALILTFHERPFDGAHESALWVINQTQQGQEAHKILQQMIRDSADVVNDRFPLNVVQANQDVDRLLATDCWDDPAALLDPVRDNINVNSYREWMSILAARLARGEGDSDRIRTVMAKIQECAEHHDDTAKIMATVSRFQKLCNRRRQAGDHRG